MEGAEEIVNDDNDKMTNVVAGDKVECVYPEMNGKASRSNEFFLVQLIRLSSARSHDEWSARA